MRKTEPMVARPSPASTNSPGTLLHRRETGALTWRGPALMLFARAALAVGAQAVVAAVFALRGSPAPWHDAEPWLPVYGTLIDVGCLATALAAHPPRGHRPARSRRLPAGASRPRRVVGLGAHPSEPRLHLRRYLCGGLDRLRRTRAAVLPGRLPLPAALYGVVVWPFIWGLTEQMTYNGYLLPRFQVLCRSTGWRSQSWRSPGPCSMLSCR